jgi:hypothetical protein
MGVWEGTAADGSCGFLPGLLSVGRLRRRVLDAERGWEVSAPGWQPEESE